MRSSNFVEGKSFFREYRRGEILISEPILNNTIFSKEYNKLPSDQIIYSIEDILLYHQMLDRKIRTSPNLSDKIIHYFISSIPYSEEELNQASSEKADAKTQEAASKSKQSDTYLKILFDQLLNKAPQMEGEQEAQKPNLFIIPMMIHNEISHSGHWINIIINNDTKEIIIFDPRRRPFIQDKLKLEKIENNFQLMETEAQKNPDQISRENALEAAQIGFIVETSAVELKPDQASYSNESEIILNFFKKSEKYASYKISINEFNYQINDPGLTECGPLVCAFSEIYLNNYSDPTNLNNLSSEFAVENDSLSDRLMLLYYKQNFSQFVPEEIKLPTPQYNLEEMTYIMFDMVKRNIRDQQKLETGAEFNINESNINNNIVIEQTNLLQIKKPFEEIEQEQKELFSILLNFVIKIIIYLSNLFKKIFENDKINLTKKDQRTSTDQDKIELTSSPISSKPKKGKGT